MSCDHQRDKMLEYKVAQFYPKAVKMASAMFTEN